MLDILKNLNKELAAFLISIAITTIIIIVSQSWWQTVYDDKSKAQSELNQAKGRYYTAINQRALLKQFEVKHEELIESGIFGDEHRINWVDSIEKITSINKIPYLKYNILPRIKVTSSDLKSNYPGIDLFKSPMTLQMQLLHEGDLFTVLSALHKKAQGLFDVKSCAIVRNQAALKSLIDSETNKNFSAKCDLNWYTIQKNSIELPKRRRS